MNSKYLRKENEEDLDYAMRLIDIKKEERPDDLDWGDIVELLGLDLNKDSLRKSQDTIFGGVAVYKKMKKRQANQEPIDYNRELETFEPTGRWFLMYRESSGVYITNTFSSLDAIAKYLINNFASK